MKLIFNRLLTAILICNISPLFGNHIRGENAVAGEGLKISESFETWPPAAWTFASPDGGRGWERYTITQDKLFGGGSYAAYAGNYTGGPTYNDQWMISPAISVETGDKFSFWMYILNAQYYKEKVEILVSETGNTPKDFTTVLETMTFVSGNEVPWTFKWYDISNYAGKTIYIAFREIQIDKTQYPALMIDLFKAGNLHLTDGALTDITVPGYLAPGLANVSGKLLNLGTKAISSFDVEYKLNEGKIEKMRITGLNILPGIEKNFSFNPHQFDAKTGYHKLKMWISNISGLGNDQDQKNDTLSKTIQVSSSACVNTPLFEEFTSSTCPPCAYYNTQYVNPFFSTHARELTLIKYQMNWPGSGDPYYISDGGTRRSYYRCDAVPRLFAGGNVSGLTSAEILNTSLNTEKNRKTYISLTANHSVNETSRQISLEVNLLPYVTSDEFILQAAVVEKETSRNASTNGETGFHNVLMKMIPDGKGTVLKLVDKVPVRLNLSASLSLTKIEEISDLAVVVFVQNNATKEVVQSVYSSDLNTAANQMFLPKGFDAQIFPSPFSQLLQIRVNQPLPDAIQLDIFAPEGRIVYSIAINADAPETALTWDGRNTGGQKVSSGIYLLRIRSRYGEVNKKVVFNP